MKATEHQLTVAAEAAGRAMYESRTDMTVAWEDLPPIERYRFRDWALPIVIAVLDALPEPKVKS